MDPHDLYEKPSVSRGLLLTISVWMDILLLVALGLAVAGVFRPWSVIMTGMLAVLGLVTLYLAAR